MSSLHEHQSNILICIHIVCLKLIFHLKKLNMHAIYCYLKYLYHSYCLPFFVRLYYKYWLCFLLIKGNIFLILSNYHCLWVYTEHCEYMCVYVCVYSYLKFRFMHLYMQREERGRHLDPDLHILYP